MSINTNKLTILNNKKCRLETSDTVLFNKIKKLLSYKTPGVEYTAAYQNGWSGINYLMNAKGEFAAGLVNTVLTYCKNNNYVIELIDNRKPLTIEEPIDLLPKLQAINKSPRDYQEKIVETAFQNRKGIVRACTGSGKSLAIALLTAKINKPTIIYVIGLDLLNQFHKTLTELFDEPIGYVGNGECRIERITVSTVWTIGSALKMNKKEVVEDDEFEDDEKEIEEKDHQKIIKMLETAKVHIFDESHVCAATTISKIYKTIDPERIYGFSGTPFRDDNTDLLITGILGEQIINVSASELITKGVLAQPIIKFIPVPSMRGAGDHYQTVYKNYIVENEIRNDLIIDNLKILLEKKYVILVLFKQIKHGKILLDKIHNAGIECEMLSGSDSLERREEVKNSLEEGKIKVILCSVIFDIGVDLPILSALILCGSGSSSIKCLQRIGRCVRPYKNKRFSAVIEFYDQVKFLKHHSMKRFKVYSSEEGFKVHPCKQMLKV